MIRYEYQLHFPSRMEVFYSDLEYGEFVNQFNDAPVANAEGDLVVVNFEGPWTYFKQIDRLPRI